MNPRSSSTSEKPPSCLTCSPCVSTHPFLAHRPEPLDDRCAVERDGQVFIDPRLLTSSTAVMLRKFEMSSL